MECYSVSTDSFNKVTRTFEYVSAVPSLESLTDYWVVSFNAKYFHATKEKVIFVLWKRKALNITENCFSLCSSEFRPTLTFKWNSVMKYKLHLK